MGSSIRQRKFFSYTSFSVDQRMKLKALYCRMITHWRVVTLKIMSKIIKPVQKFSLHFKLAVYMFNQ